MNRKTKFQPVRWLLIGFAIAMIGYGAVHLFFNARAYHEAEAEYQNLAADYTRPKPDASRDAGIDAAEKTQENETLSIDWESLRAKNPDLVCWLQYEDTGTGIDISMPVVQAAEEDPDRYLTTTFDGQSNPSGCVFVDAGADFRKDSNVFLYGHNMRNGTMFGDLKRLYQEPDQVMNPAFCLYFPDGSVSRYQILSVCLTTSGSDLYYVPGGKKEFSAYLSRLRQNTVFPDLTRFDALTKESGEGDPEQGKEQKLVTLSTCDGSAGTKRRLLVTGIWKETEKE